MTTQEVIEWYIRRQRDRGHLQPGKLADSMGLSGQMITMILNGTRRFPMARIDGAATFFGLTSDTLIQTARATYEEEEAHSAGSNNPPPGGNGAPFPELQPDRRKTNLGPPAGADERRRAQPQRHEA